MVAEASALAAADDVQVTFETRDIFTLADSYTGFFPIREGGGGSPFPVYRDEIDWLLSDGFRVISAAAPFRSAERRAGLEWLVVAERD